MCLGGEEKARIENPILEAEKGLKTTVKITGFNRFDYEGIFSFVSHQYESDYLQTQLCEDHQR